MEGGGGEEKGRRMKKRGRKGKGEDGEGGEGRREERRALLPMIWLMDISVTMYQFINLSVDLPTGVSQVPCHH